ncbi:MAG: hypothetical protein RR862_02640, partial [Eggerthellaceae bacterium]
GFLHQRHRALLASHRAQPATDALLQIYRDVVILKRNRSHRARSGADTFAGTQALFGIADAVVVADIFLRLAAENLEYIERPAATRAAATHLFLR